MRGTLPPMAPIQVEFTVQHYEGLARKTAAMYAPFVETEYEDIVQRLRIKAWRALQVYDAAKSKMPVERYVFMCMKNEAKDVLKKVKRGEVYIEDQGFRFLENPSADDQRHGSAFEARYMATDHDETFAEIEEPLPLIPSTLTSVERRVIVMLYRDYTQAEIARGLGLRRNQMERTMRSIRAKMADWRPSAPQPQPVAA